VSAAAASLGGGAAGVPTWLRGLVAAATGPNAQPLWPAPPDAGTARAAGVLVLFGQGGAGPDVLLTRRAGTLRTHPGQPAFPGGGQETGDVSVAAAALREAVEETGLDPAGVEVLAELDALWLPPSGYLVTPVIAWWARPSPVRAADPDEVAAVHRVPLSVLTDPANRGSVTGPRGFTGPAFAVADMVVWGFTAGLLDALLSLGGLERPWDSERRFALPAGPA